tara:strand:- start:641 stop:868 length:228 start_codon:yes stop_codon:yes gene_type:complete
MKLQVRMGDHELLESATIKVFGKKYDVAVTLKNETECPVCDAPNADVYVLDKDDLVLTACEHCEIFTVCKVKRGE